MGFAFKAFLNMKIESYIWNHYSNQCANFHFCVDNIFPIDFCRWPFIFRLRIYWIFGFSLIAAIHFGASAVGVALNVSKQLDKDICKDFIISYLLSDSKWMNECIRFWMHLAAVCLLWEGKKQCENWPDNIHWIRYNVNDSPAILLIHNFPMQYKHAEATF